MYRGTRVRSSTCALYYPHFPTSDLSLIYLFSSRVASIYGRTIFCGVCLMQCGPRYVASQVIEHLHTGTAGNVRIMCLEGLTAALLVALPFPFSPVAAWLGTGKGTGRNILVYGAFVSVVQCAIALTDPQNFGLGGRFHEHGHDEDATVGRGGGGTKKKKKHAE